MVLLLLQLELILHLAVPVCQAKVLQEFQLACLVSLVVLVLLSTFFCPILCLIHVTIAKHPKYYMTNRRLQEENKLFIKQWLLF